MDPLKHFQSTEECSSHESGWTTYLVSATQDNYSKEHDIIKDDHSDGNSDDSMVSDASSAPSHDHHNYKHKDGDHNNVYNKHEGDHTSRRSSLKEAKKEVNKNAESSTGKSKKKRG